MLPHSPSHPFARRLLARGGRLARCAVLLCGCSVDARSVDVVGPGPEQVSEANQSAPGTGTAPAATVRCGQGTHLCGDACVSDADPGYCAGTCEPCPSSASPGLAASNQMAADGSAGAGGSGASPAAAAPSPAAPAPSPAAPAPSPVAPAAPTAAAPECPTDQFFQRDGCHVAAVQISAGSSSTCAVLRDTTVRCWGANQHGEVGYGRIAATADAPVVVPGLSGVRQVSVGTGTACALLEDSSVSCWGSRVTLQGGSSVTTDDLAPVLVPGISDASAIAVGNGLVCALSTGGGVSCWGSNDFGQLGDGSVQASPLPVQVRLGSGDVGIALSAEERTACVTLTTGRIKCWGASFGATPVDAGFAGAVGVSRWTETCAWNAAGELSCLEDGSTSPVRLPDFGVVDQAASGFGIRCALDRGSHNLYCQYLCPASGPGNPVYCTYLPEGETPPMTFPDLGTVAAVASGGGHTCALRADGSVWCWGENTSGQSGSLTESILLTPSPVWPW